MDILVDKVPNEVAVQILSFLSPTDLLKCLSVCKKWHDLINTDYLWRRHYISKFGFEKLEKNVYGDNKICEYLMAYRITMRRLNRWEHDKPKCFEIDLEHCDYVFACGSRTIAIYYFTPLKKNFEQLHIYSFDDTLKCQKVINLPLPGDGIVHLVTNDLFIFISRDNFVLCYKIKNKKLYQFLSLCIKDLNIEYSKNDHINFINKNRNEEDRILNIRLVDDFLWMDRRFISFIFNLKTNSVKTVERYNFIGVWRDLVSTWNCKEAVVYSGQGKICLKLAFDHFIDNLCHNESILVSVHTKMWDSHNRYVDTTDMKTGAKLYRKDVKRYTDVTIQKEFDAVLLLERSSRDMYKISSFCPRSGETMWSIEHPNRYYKLWTTIFCTVTSKHLCVWPPHNRTDAYIVVNVKTGKQLYQSEKPCGDILCVTDSFFISLSQRGSDKSTLSVRTFL